MGLLSWERDDAEVFTDVLGQDVVDLAVARDRLLLPGSGIDVDIVPAAMAHQYAAGSQQLTDQFVALQKAMSLIS